MNDELEKKLNDLWDYCEKHLQGRDDYDDIDKQLRKLDDLNCDDKLTASKLATADKKLRGLLRAYLVDHSTGCVDRSYYSAKDSNGRTNYAKRKQIKKPTAKHIKDKPRGVTQRDYYLEYDVSLEIAKVQRALTQSGLSGSKNEAASAQRLAGFHETAEARREALEAVMRAEPNTPYSVILRRPEFDRSNEPHKPAPRT